MNSTVAAAVGRVRDFKLEAALGASFMLLIVATAYGAGAAVTIPRLPAAAPAPVVTEPAPPPVPARPEPLLVIGEPVPGHEVNSPFGLRRLPWENHGRLHEGVDIAAPIGKPVLAAADGFVIRSGHSSSYGRYVELVHAEGLTTLYAHLGRIDARAVKRGAKVAAGEPIGRVGSSGTSTGPHVHFEIRKKNKPLNPVAFMGREFATAEDLPLKSAARYSRRVRVAHVSYIPKAKRALMADKDAKDEVRKGKDGRPRQTLRFTSSKPAIVVEEAPSAVAAGVDTNAILPIPPAAPAPAEATATAAD